MRGAFLRLIEAGCSITKACEICGFDRRTALRSYSSDLSFFNAVCTAKAKAKTMLLKNVWIAASNGDARCSLFMLQSMIFLPNRMEIERATRHELDQCIKNPELGVEATCPKTTAEG